MLADAVLFGCVELKLELELELGVVVVVVVVTTDDDDGVAARAQFFLFSRVSCVSGEDTSSCFALRSLSHPITSFRTRRIPRPRLTLQATHTHLDPRLSSLHSTQH